MNDLARWPSPRSLILASLLAGLAACAPGEPKEAPDGSTIARESAPDEESGGGDSGRESGGDSGRESGGDSGRESGGDSGRDTEADSEADTGPSDADGDGVFAAQDCDDGNAAIYPGAPEVCDGADDDCDGEADEGVTLVRYADGDGDGFGAGAALLSCVEVEGYVADASDCDDNNNRIYPGAAEVCDGADQDCDGAADDGVTLLRYQDADGDGFGDPGRPEELCAEAAGRVAEGTDCDDRSALVNPAGLEVCGGIDEDCDGLVDDADPQRDPGASAWYADGDGDGFGDPATARGACLPAAGEVADGSDCDDGAAAIHPAAAEVCDALDVDEDCDGASDDGDASVDPAGMAVWYADRDGDGFGDAGEMLAACDLPPGYVSDSLDCDDGDGATYPGAPEVCDALDRDEDCDGLAEDDDEDSAGQMDFYIDGDGDGWGKADTILPYCDAPDASYVLVGGDCADDDPAVNPGAQEVCDALDRDEDCDELSDDADGSAAVGTMARFWQDQDRDGYGGSVGTDRCDPIGNYVVDGSDCNDWDWTVYPGAQEVCDALDRDEDCDGLSNDADSSVDSSGYTLWYEDADGDGYGDLAFSTLACDALTSTVSNGWDCDDGDASIRPGGQEVCDALGVDEDCDGQVNDADGTTLLASQTPYYDDLDRDGYGAGFARYACVVPSGPSYSTVNGDCNDRRSAVHPGATEVCDLHGIVDEDCDGLVDNADPSVDLSTGRDWYVDADDDVYGVGSMVTTACGTPRRGSGYSGLAGDCDDTNAMINPGIAEVCQDGIESNCVLDCVLAYSHDPSAADLTLAEANGSTDPADTYNYGAVIVGSGDLTGDGFGDLAVSDPAYDSATQDDLGRISIYPGGSAGVSSAASATITGSAGEVVGTDVSVMPDVNGDGVEELLVGAYSSPGGYTSGGRAWLFYGPLSGAMTTADADLTLSASGNANLLGWRVSAAGDQDGDGIEDWAASGYGYSSYRGRVVLLSGAASGAVNWTAAGSIASITGSAASSRLGSQLDRADVDGDGVTDLLVGASGSNAAMIFLGGVSGALVTADADHTLSIQLSESSSGLREPYGSYGWINAGDTDGDGLDDVVVGCDLCSSSPEAGTLYLFLSPPSAAILQTSDAVATLDGGIMGSHSGRVISAGDVNGDGLSDLFRNQPDLTNGAGARGYASLYYGPMVGTLYSLGDAFFTTSIAGSVMSQRVAVIDDLDGDSHDEVALSFLSGGIRSALLFYGNSE